MKPSVGRIVHYGYVSRWVPTSGAAVEHKGLLVECAAIITRWVGPDRVCLSVFLPDGDEEMGKQDVAFSEELKEGCWSWPPRVD